ncbi:MAG: hypothetical protein M9962_03570 [Oligoflexia bacterium]|nr:hypothetical protein [Oligoflexia bacterium]
MTKLFLINLLFVFPVIVFANEDLSKFHCDSPENVGKYVSYCEDNGYIAEMASYCVSKYESRWAAQVEKEKGGRQVASYGNSNSERPDFSEEVFSHSIQDQEFLADFVKDVRSASDSVEAYLDEVVLPEDFDVEEITGGDMEGFLEAAPCYNQNISYIEASAYQMNKIATHLEGNLQQIMDSAKNEQTKPIRELSSNE